MDFILDILGKVGFDWRMALFNFINFLIIFFILKKFAFGPIMQAIEERQQKATATVENYQKAKTELQHAEKKAQELIDEAKVERNKVIQESVNEANAAAEAQKQKAVKEIEGHIAQAKATIATEKEAMKEALKKETAALVIEATRKIIGDELDAKKDASYAQDVLKSIK